MLTLSDTAVIIDQVDLHEPRHRVAGLRQVRIGIRLFSNDPGLVCDRPRRLIAAGADASRGPSLRATSPPAARPAHR